MNQTQQLDIHLYGQLRSLVEGSTASEDTILRLDYIEGETFIELVGRLNLTRKDIGDCFIDGTLAKPDAIIPSGARIGLFPFNMVLLCGGQHLKGHGYTQEDVDIDYY
ncbi:MAG: hypothetical protein RTU92_11800 [Candidatus Thorarchaeota archaeon]